MDSDGTNRPYAIISSDCHAGADLRDYKPYLERRWHEEFDTWAPATRTPGLVSTLSPSTRRVSRRSSRPSTGTAASASRSWRAGHRRRSHLPQHHATVLPQWPVGRPGAAEPERVRPSLGRYPGPQPVARRLLRLEAGLAVAVTGAMLAITTAAALWWAAIAQHAPWFLQGTANGSDRSPFDPQLVFTLGLMLAAVLTAGYGVARITRSARALRAE